VSLNFCCHYTLISKSVLKFIEINFFFFKLNFFSYEGKEEIASLWKQIFRSESSKNDFDLIKNIIWASKQIEGHQLRGFVLNSLEY